MTELSPAAQVVLDAINKELNEAPWDLTFIAGSAAAAALRAIATQEEILFDEYDEPTSAVQINQLLAIADELENT